jgi:hypothetical protein
VYYQFQTLRKAWCDNAKPIFETQHPTMYRAYYYADYGDMFPTARRTRKAISRLPSSPSPLHREHTAPPLTNYMELNTTREATRC